jgi:type IV secretion system protein VirD4
VVLTRLGSQNSDPAIARLHHIRTKKARCFENRRKGAWSELKPQRLHAVLAAQLDKAEGAANGGLRREPELPDHGAIAKETTSPAAADEFSIMLDDEPEDAARQRQALRPTMLKAMRTFE